MPDTWALVHAERHALIDDLAALEDQQWDTPSLCQGWSVHDVAAHLVDNAKTSVGGMVVAMVRARFDFDRQNAQGLAREKGATPAETLLRLRAVADRTTSPPASLDSRLVEEVLHGEDIRRALSDRGQHPGAHVDALGPNYVKTGKPLNGKSRTKGLSFRSTDSSFRHGEGPEVAGPGMDVIMAISGRLDALDHCEGDGVQIMRAGA